MLPFPTSRHSMIFTITVVLASVVTLPGNYSPSYRYHGLVQADVHVAYPHLVWLSTGDDLFSSSRDAFHAAVNEYNSKGGLHNGTEPIVVHEFNASNHEETIQGVNALPDVVTIFSWYLVRAQREIISPWLEQQNLMILGSQNDDPTFLNGQLNYVTPWNSLDFHIFGIANYVLAVRRWKRICTLAIDFTGTEQEFLTVSTEYERNALRQAFDQLEREITCEIVIPAADLDAVANLAISSLSQHKPQAVIVLGIPQASTAAFFATTVLAPVVLDPDFTIVGSSLLLAAFRATLEFLNVTELGTRVNLVTFGPSPGISRTEFRLVQKFTESMDALYGVGNTTGRDSDGLLAYHLAKWFLSILDTAPILTREGIKKHLYSNLLVEVEDLLHGLYSNQTSTSVALPIGQCNLGAKKLYYSRMLNNLSSTAVREADYEMSVTRCHPNEDEVRRPVFTPTVARLCPTDRDATNDEFQHLTRMTVVGAHGLLYTKLPTTEILTTSNCGDQDQASSLPYSSFAQLYEDYLASYVVTAFISPQISTQLTELPDRTEDGSWTAIFDPIPRVPELASRPSSSQKDKARLTRGDVVHFTPSLDQQLFVIMQYIGGSHTKTTSPSTTSDEPTSSTTDHTSPSTPSSSASLLIHRDVDLGAIKEVADQARFTAGMESISIVRFSGTMLTTEDLAAAVHGGKSFIIVLGVVTTQDAQTLASFILSLATTATVSSSSIAGRTTPSIFMEYKEYSQHYTTISTALSSNAAAMDRLLVATSFPSLLGNTSTIEKNFQTHRQKTTSSSPSGGPAASIVTPPSPMAMQGYITGRVLKILLERMARGTGPQQLLTTLYDVAVIGLDSSYQFGPFSNSSSSSRCYFGARAVSIYSLASQYHVVSLSPSATSPVFSFTFSDCSIPYKLPQDESSLSSALIAMIAVLGLLLVAFLLVIVSFFVSRSREVRDTSTAPKDDSKPFAVMFTDIQSSTMLWSRLPSDMGAALDAHHTMIRQLIKKHKAYEVKTIGDAFLIVHSEAKALVTLAEELQENLFQYSWGTSAFDEVYKEAEQEARETAAAASTTTNVVDEGITLETNKKPHTFSDPDYEQKWSGLRVRIGIHFGRGEIHFDQVSKGYDYYGTVVNTASRVESSADGGQVIVSDAVFRKVCDVDCAPDQNKFKAMGAHSLRGVQEPIELFQLEFRNRQYKPLATLTNHQNNSSLLLEDEGSCGGSRSGTGTVVGSHQSSYQSLAATATSHREEIITSDSVAKKYLGNIASQRIKMEMSYGHSYLTLLLSSTPDSERKKLVQKLAERWRVDTSMLSRESLSTKVAVDWGIWSLTERVTKVHVQSNSAKSTLGSHLHVGGTTTASHHGGGEGKRHSVNLFCDVADEELLSTNNGAISSTTKMMMTTRQQHGRKRSMDAGDSDDTSSCHKVFSSSLTEANNSRTSSHLQRQNQPSPTPGFVGH